MASKKLPNYVHCAKCGYRGISPEHDCTEVRAATAKIVEQAARRQEALRLDPGPPPADFEEDAAARQAIDHMFATEAAIVEAPLPFPTRLIRFALEHGRVFGRSMEYSQIPNEKFTLVEIRQRCACCCSDITKRTSVDVDDSFLGVQLSAEARKAYLMHRCPPLSQSLVGFTDDELEVLHAECERDGQRLVERQAAIEKLQKERRR